MTQDQRLGGTRHSPARWASNQFSQFTQVVLPGRPSRADARPKEGDDFDENSPSTEQSEEDYLSYKGSVSGSSAKQLDWDQLAIPKRQSSGSRHSTRQKKWKQVEILWDRPDNGPAQDNAHESEDEGDVIDAATEQMPDDDDTSLESDQPMSSDSLSDLWKAVQHVSETGEVRWQKMLVHEPKASPQPQYSEKANSDSDMMSLNEYEVKSPSEYKKKIGKLRLDCKEKSALECRKKSPAAYKKKSIEYMRKSPAKYKKSPRSPLIYKKSQTKSKQKSPLEFKERPSIKLKNESVPVLKEEPSMPDKQPEVSKQNNALTPLAQDFVPAPVYQLSEAEQFYQDREQALRRSRYENDISVVKLKIWKGLLPDDPPRRELTFPLVDPTELANRKLKQRAKYENYDENLLHVAELPDDLKIVCAHHFALLRQAVYVGWDSNECQAALERAANLFAGIRKLEFRHASYFQRNETARKYITILDHRRKTYHKKLHEQRKMSKLEQQLVAFNVAIDMLEQADAIITANDMCLRYQFPRLTLEMKGEIAERIYEWRQKRTNTYNNVKVIWKSIKDNATAKLVNLTLTAMLPRKPTQRAVRKKQQHVQEYESSGPAISPLISPQEFYSQLYKSFTQQRNMLEGEIIDRMQDVNILTRQLDDLTDVQLQEKYALLLREAQRDFREVERLAANLEQQASEAAKKLTDAEQMEQTEQVQEVEAASGYQCNKFLLKLATNIDIASLHLREVDQR
ncbi:hypothetical protein V1517DRAFT_318363 [Lipomyces orientalis]|uniref:Uncharacterized protein n=1 Tax=Lipomyces orientalis TaxID=1233043 RepID=A0ACC3TT96_9ASCO